MNHTLKIYEGDSEQVKTMRPAMTVMGVTIYKKFVDRSIYDYFFIGTEGQINALSEKLKCLRDIHMPGEKDHPLSLVFQFKKFLKSEITNG